jgi:hypothetical protein
LLNLDLQRVHSSPSSGEMKNWLIPTLVLFVTASLTYWLLRTPSTTPAAPVDKPAAVASNSAAPPAPLLSHPPGPASPQGAVAPQPSRVSASATASASATVAVRRPAVSSSGSAPSATPSAEAPAMLPPDVLLENVRTTLRQYGLMFDGNPVGTNPEITKALAGENAKQVNFLGTDANRVNQKGELVDAWGTPYFFHQLSAMQMEIRSAGPDKIMWTADDLVIK